MKPATAVERAMEATMFTGWIYDTSSRMQPL